MRRTHALLIQKGIDLAGPRIGPSTDLRMVTAKHQLPTVIDVKTVTQVADMRVTREWKSMLDRGRMLRFSTPPSRLNRKYAVGYVPTMGGLHEGHLALIEASQAECVFTVASIFLNPKQFGANEDLDTYPADLERDIRILAEAGVDSLFLPTADQLYPPGFKMYLDYEGIEEHPEGRSRRDHFRGVATICNKLFNIVNPNMVYVGQKDALQCIVLRSLIRDYNLDMGLTVCPTVREIDGLAMSSRNAYLSPEDRAEAVCIHHSMTTVNTMASEYFRERFRGGEAPPTAGQIREATRAELSKHLKLGEIEYVAVGDKEDMSEFSDDTPVQQGCFLSVVVRYGSTRLLDNLRLGHDEEEYWRLNEKIV